MITSSGVHYIQATIISIKGSKSILSNNSKCMCDKIVQGSLFSTVLASILRYIIHNNICSQDLRMAM